MNHEVHKPIVRAPSHRRHLTLLALLSCFCATALKAEVTTQQYTCGVGEDSRTVSLTYLDQPGSVPCEIREQKGFGQQQVLWRAQNDSSFCERQFEGYHSKLLDLGWPCEPIRTAQNNNTLSTNTVEPLAGAALAAPTDTLAGTAALQTGDVTSLTRVEEDSPEDAPVVIFEETLSLPSQPQAPAPPGNDSGDLSVDDILEMDDWLIYLSAQTMASIKQLSPDAGTFENYQRAEQRTAANIYERLQSRIEYLNRLVRSRSPDPARLSESGF